MALASLFAGLAFNNTKTAACHSISYPMTYNYNVPHGLAVSITIKEVIKFNNQVVPNKVAQIVEEFGSPSLEAFVEEMPGLMQSIGLPVKLSDLKLKKEDVELLVDQSVNPDRMKNNPAQLSRQDIHTILTNIY